MKKISIVKNYYNGAYDVGSISYDKSIITVNGANSQIETIREYYSQNEKWETITIKNKLVDFFDRLDGHSEWVEADMEEFLQLFETIDKDYKNEFNSENEPIGDEYYIEIDEKKFIYNNSKCTDENYKMIYEFIDNFNPLTKLSTKLMKVFSK